MANLKSILPPMPAIRDLLKVYDLQARKQLSQNFLLDMNICRKIVKQTGSLANCHACEVGPGPGSITRAILEQAPASLHLVEKDSRFFPSLNLIASATKIPVHIKHADVLNFDFGTCFDESLKKDWHDDPTSIHLIGNLPFNIATPLIIKLLRDMCLRQGIFRYGRCPLLLTFQKEVGQRMVAKISSGYRCRLSVMTQIYADVKQCFIIPGTAFLPKPKVDVSVMKFLPFEIPRIRLHFDLVEKFCQHFFHYRQKKCIRCVEILFPPEHQQEFSHEILRKARVSPIAKCISIGVEEIRDMCFAYRDLCMQVPGLYFYDYRAPKKSLGDWKDKGGYPPEYPFANEFEKAL